MDGRWVLSKQMQEQTFAQGTARAQGKIGYPKPLEKFGSLTGAPVVEKFIGYAPIEDIGRCKNCAKLFIIAENEELFANKDNAIRAYEQATGKAPPTLATLRAIASTMDAWSANSSR